MNLRENEIAEQRCKRKEPSQVEGERRRQRAAQQQVAGHRDKVLGFRQWCALCGFSLATGRRLLKSGAGPPVVQLSPRRIGIRENDNAMWQQARER